MRKLVLMVISAAVLAGCGERHRTGEQTEEQRRTDSIREYRRTHQHKYSMNYAAAKFYKMHDPDCPLCRETRRRETVAVVDSMLRERLEKTEE